MTIEWGDPIECNGVRPDWLRDDERVSDVDPGCATNGKERAAKHWNWRLIKAFCVRSDHPAYVALARGFTPWSGGESAPDDWDGGDVLLRCGSELFCDYTNPPYWEDRGMAGSVIGYRKRNTCFDEPHLARIEVEGSAPVEGVFIKRMTEAEAADLIDTVNGSFASLSQGLALLRRLGLVESRAERFTRETGHAVTEAVEAALNWKES